MLLKEGLPYLHMSICRQETFHDWSVGLQCGWIYCTKFVESLPINSSLRNLLFPEVRRNCTIYSSRALNCSCQHFSYGSIPTFWFCLHPFNLFPIFSREHGERSCSIQLSEISFCVFKAWHLGSLWWKSLVMGMGWHGYVPSSRGSQHFRNLEKTFSHHLVWFLISF